MACLFLLDFPDVSKLFGRSENEVAVLLAIMATVMLAGVLALKLKTDFMLGVARFFMRPLPQRWSVKITDAIRSFISGLTQTSNPLEVLWIGVIAVSLWLISAYTVWMVVDACGVDLGVAQTMTVLMGMVIAVSIPAAPGYAGTYHYFASVALMQVTPIPKEEALIIATLIHAANYIPQTALGLGALMFEGIKFADVKKARETLDSENPAEA